MPGDIDCTITRVMRTKESAAKLRAGAHRALCTEDVISVADTLARATHVLCTAPPGADGDDAVLALHMPVLRNARRLRWVVSFAQ